MRHDKKGVRPSWRLAVAIDSKMLRNDVVDDEVFGPCVYIFPTLALRRGKVSDAGPGGFRFLLKVIEWPALHDTAMLFSQSRVKLDFLILPLSLGFEQ